MIKRNGGIWFIKACGITVTVSVKRNPIHPVEAFAAFMSSAIFFAASLSTIL